MAHGMHTSVPRAAARPADHRHCCVHHHHTRPRCCRATLQEVAQAVPHLSALSDAAVPSLAVLADLQAGVSTAAATATADAPTAAAAAARTSSYVPGPVEVGWQIWFAAFVSTVPFVIGAYEFGKRIVIQRRCKVCDGSGLVQRGRYQRKCPECGGFFPWVSWSMFLSANARPGNGGPLLQPRGQNSVFYTVPPAQEQAEGSSQVAADAGSTDGGGSAAAAERQPVAAQQQKQQQQQKQKQHDN